MLLCALSAPQFCFALGSESLKKFYEQTYAMQANFHQIVTDSKGRKLQDVRGEMQMKRPNKFRWDYQKPYEQQIISDGKQVWLYDTDLAQVTVRNLDKVLGNSPAALLAGEDEIDANYVLRDFNRPDQLAWVAVVPKNNETGFSKIHLAFNKDQQLQEMELVDSFGQQTRIIFSEYKQNPNIPAKTFLFKTPKNVDVVGE
jgi:outer membrane lipoprotein carrier protein